MSKKDYFPALSRWRKRRNHIPPVHQTPVATPEPRPLPDAKDISWQAGQEPVEPPKRTHREWLPGRDYFPHRTYVILDQFQEDPSKSEYRMLRAVDTHIEVTYAYCQAGHLHCYHNGVIMPPIAHKVVSKHYSKPIYLDESRDLGWKDKTVVAVDACD